MINFFNKWHVSKNQYLSTGVTYFVLQALLLLLLQSCGINGDPAPEIKANRTAAIVEDTSKDPDANSDKIVPDADSGVSESVSVSVPTGSLAAGTTLAVNSGQDMFESDAETQQLSEMANLSDSGNSLLGSSDAVIVSSNKKENLATPMTLKLDLPANFSLAAFLAQTSSNNIAVLYKIIDYSTPEADVKFGVLGQNDLNVEGESVVVTSSYLGSFQVISTEEPVLESKLEPSTSPIVNSDGEVLEESKVEPEPEPELPPVNQQVAPLQKFEAATGIEKPGNIDLTIEFPEDYSLLARVEIRRQHGIIAPEETCDGETDNIVRIIKKFTNEAYQVTDQTLVTDGSAFSYRACLFDEEDVLQSSTVIQNVGAYKPKEPLLADAGEKTGEIELTINWPYDISEYAKADVVRIKSNKAPNEDCVTDGKTTFGSPFDFGKVAG